MLLGEPERTPYDLNFRLFGIPVRVHPLFWLVAVLLRGGLTDARSVLTWVAAVFVSILIHELGHALTMRAFGFQPWIVLYGMGGLACYDPRAGGRAKGHGTLAQILIDFAGPGAGFLLAVSLVAVLFAAGYGDQMGRWGPAGLIPGILLPKAPIAQMFLNDLFQISILWGLLNLLPVYPLDGGQIAREIFLKINPWNGIVWSLLLSTFVGIGMAAYSAVHGHEWFLALFFGYLAYANYATLETYRGRGPR